MSKGKRASQIKLIPIEKIHILNPRVRNQKVFLDIATNMTRVGLKRPITVTPCKSGTEGKDYDLICGQGRIEAFMACGQTEIPAIVIDTDEEQALIMSLVENLARRQHHSNELMKGIEVLHQQGYGVKDIAAKTGLSPEYAQGVLNLIDRGEDRLLSAVESGKLPMFLAIKIVDSPGNEQRALQEAYESKQLKGKKFMLVKRIIDTRRRHGKTFGDDRTRKRNNSEPSLSVRDVLKVYQREVDRKRLLARKADNVSNRLLFITEALRHLFKDGNFNNLLRAEGLNSLPKPLAALMDEKAH